MAANDGKGAGLRLTSESAEVLARHPLLRKCPVYPI